MKSPSVVKVATPPARPVLIYDGDCHFCRFCIARARAVTGPSVEYLPARHPDTARRFPEIDPGDYERAVQFIRSDGGVVSGAAAIFQAFALSPARVCRGAVALALQVPGLAGMAERIYSHVAAHRPWYSRVTRWLGGRQTERPEYAATRWFFLRALGLVYLAAFLSLGMQINGLIGPQGILPADRFIAGLGAECQAQGLGWERFVLAPTLCWLGASGTFLNAQCAAGVLAAVVLIADVAPALCLALLWLLYLSLVTVGQDFLAFQWDNLLLEAGFLAVFLAPRQWLPRRDGAAAPSRLMLWLLRLLLFKLMFSSGCVKWLSHDPSWRQFTALSFHYQTQPLPTWLAWYAAQAPAWFQQTCCAGMFAIELGAPFLLFGPRRARLLGVAAIALLQVLILLTGNYGFFNYLTLALCLPWLDDFAFRGLLFENLLGFGSPPRPVPPGCARWPGLLLSLIAIVSLSVSALQVGSLFGSSPRLAAPVVWVERWIAPFRTVNSYGLFAVMTTTRNEIVVEGSNDAIHWLPYSFKAKPGDTGRAPPFVAPFQPRLDWQMWFAALGGLPDNPWFGNFCERLLAGSPPVLALLADNPFPRQPPRFLRAELQTYRFSTPAERRATGDWWRQKWAGAYAPVMQQAR